MKDIGARCLGVVGQLNNMANHSSRSMPDRIADGAEDSESNSEVYSFISQNGENESENEEWANLRCSSLQTEIVSERNRRNRQRSAGYPGLAFGSSIFSSGTMMKFSIISNELHNIMNVQLKRAEGEVSALLKRIQTLEEGLGRSEESLKTASVELEEASQAINESERRRQMLEHRNITDKERMDALEDHLKEAMLMAVEAARKFDEVTET